MKNEIDPQLPYIQIHRSVAAKASQLAQRLSVSVQHARGGFEMFWESLADRRLLAGKTELVLTAKEIAMRLHFAFDQPVDPEMLVCLGILEPRENGAYYRVRGMSRYIEAERARAAKSETLRRRASLGSDPTDTRVAPGCDSGTTRVAPQWHPGGNQVPPGCHPTETRDERREARGETTPRRCGPSAIKPPDASDAPKEATPSAPHALGAVDAGQEKPTRREKPEDVARFKGLVTRLGERFAEKTGARYAFCGAKDAIALRRLMRQATDEDILDRWRRGLSGRGWLATRTVAQLAGKWNDLAPTSPEEAQRAAVGADDAF